MTDAVVRARIDAKTKKQAASALDAMGLSISDAIRMMMVRVAEEKRLPFEVKVPNAATRKAMADAAARRGKRFKTVEELFKDLGI